MKNHIEEKYADFVSEMGGEAEVEKLGAERAFYAGAVAATEVISEDNQTMESIERTCLDIVMEVAVWIRKGYVRPN